MHFLARSVPRLYRLPEYGLRQPITVSTLQNGIRVASQRMVDSKDGGALTCGLWIDTGSRYETEENNGTAHFLEHLAFKGTRTRNRLNFEKEIENMGAHLNAYTSREHTTYFARVFKNDLAKGADIISDIITNSVYDPRAIEEERGVIMREAEEVAKAFEEVLFDQLHLEAFSSNPLGYTILGPEKNIRSIRRDHVVDYVRKHYTGERMVVVAVGDVDHNEFHGICEEKFGKIPASSGYSASLETPTFKPCLKVFNSEDPLGNKNSYFALAFEGAHWNSPDHVQLMVLQQLIGNYKRGEGVIPPHLSSNRAISGLASKVDMHSVLDLAAFNASYRDTGLWGCYVSCEEGVMEPTMEHLLLHVLSLQHSISEEEVERAKRELVVALLGNLDSTTQVAEDIGRQMLTYGRRIPPAEFLAKLNSIDAAEMRRIARDYSGNAEKMALVGVGPEEAFQKVLGKVKSKMA